LLQKVMREPACRNQVGSVKLARSSYWKSSCG